jgi:hypothetical protein
VVIGGSGGVTATATANLVTFYEGFVQWSSGTGTLSDGETCWASEPNGIPLQPGITHGRLEGKVAAGYITGTRSSTTRPWYSVVPLPHVLDVMCDPVGGLNVTYYP